jgi:predicted alpha/beta-hydrolase family hydrolase
VLRAAHLPAIGRPMLFVQGSRDNFGTPSELNPILAGLSPPPTLHVVASGDHSLKVSRDPQAQAAIYDDVQRTIVRWMQSVIGR